MNQQNCLDNNMIMSILAYLPRDDLNTLAGSVYSSDSKEIQDEFYNEHLLDEKSIGECLMIYSWHDRFWRDHIAKRVLEINSVLVDDNYNLKIEMKKIRGNYRFMFIKEIWKRIKNWDLFQKKKRERVSYIDDINTKITAMVDPKSVYRHKNCEEIIRRRIGQFYIEESSVELPLKEKLFLGNIEQIPQWDLECASCASFDKTENYFKWVSIGTFFVGKSSLLQRVATDSYSYFDYCPEFENKIKTEKMPCIIDGIQTESEFISNLLDTTGHEYDKYRPLSYPETSVFTMEYAVNNIASLKHLVENFVWECSLCAPQATFVVVSTKNDLKCGLYWNSLFDPNNVKEPISKEEGIKFAKAIGAVSFIETSAKNGKGTKNLDKRLAIIRHLHLKHLDELKMKPNKKCNIQ